MWYNCGTLPCGPGLLERGLFPGFFTVVRIDAQRYGRVGVAHEVLNLFNVHASLEASGSIGVPQYMGRYLLIGQHKVASAFLWNHRTAATSNQLPQILERGVVVVRAILPVENKEGRSI